jgi:hypothetical protein
VAPIELSGCWEYPAANRRVEKKEKKIQNTKADIQLHHQMGVI